VKSESSQERTNLTNPGIPWNSKTCVVKLAYPDDAAESMANMPLLLLSAHATISERLTNPLVAPMTGKSRRRAPSRPRALASDLTNLIDLNEWFRHAITGPAQGPWIVWLRVVGELRV
jgi:hypothetical protein